MKNIKPIAMKCTEEQFNAIRKILLDNGLVIGYLSKFEEPVYLVNNLNGVHGYVCNLGDDSKNDHQRTVFEKWNQDTFLEYCGIKTEKQTEKNMGYKLTVPVTDVLKIHKVACSNWKRIISNYLTRVDSEQNITFTEKEVDDMFAAATSEQKPVLTEIFGEKKKEIDYDRLKTGSKVMIKYTGQHCNGIEGIDTNQPVDIVFYKSPCYISNNNMFGTGDGYQRFIVFYQNGKFAMFRSEQRVDYITEVIEY